MLFSTTLVMLQTPAMGLAQAGLIRIKNVMSMITQIVSGAGQLALAWYVFGFSMVFGPSGGGLVGNPLTFAFFRGMGSENCFVEVGPRIPSLLYGGFQMTFALMTPLIITGAWAERMQYKSFVLFINVWSVLVYYPVAHWIWNVDGWLARLGVLDFAGGMVIHETSGVAALVVAWYIAKRRNMNTEPHNLIYTFIGCFLVWIGWFCFNGGSALAADSVAVLAVFNTELAACAGGCVSLWLGWWHTGQFKATHAMNGILAGLATITPASGYVDTWGVVIPMAGACASYYVCDFINALEIDDVLDVFALQAVPGVLGSLAMPLCILPRNIPAGFHRNDFEFFSVQLLSVVVVGAYTALVTLLVCVLVDKTVGINITKRIEAEGLDKVEHGEFAYNFKELHANKFDEVDHATYFLSLVSEGNLTDVKAFYKVNGKADYLDYDRRSGLHIASAHGSLSMVKFLEAKGLDPDATDAFGRKPIEDAVQNGCFEVVSYLKDRTQYEPLAMLHKYFTAVSEGNQHQVKTWLEYGVPIDAADYDKRSALHLAVGKGDYSMCYFLMKYDCDVLLPDRWGKTPLDYSAQLADLKIYALLKKTDMESVQYQLRELMERRPSGQQHDLDFIACVSRNDVKEVKRQLQLAANVNSKDYDGRTALHIAVAHNHLELVQLLLASKGIQVNPVDAFEFTPLKEAQLKGLGTMCKLLRRHGGAVVHRDLGYKVCRLGAEGAVAEMEAFSVQELNTADYDLRTCVHLAVCNKHYAAVEYLLKRGVDTKCRDFNGKTAYDDAEDDERMKELFDKFEQEISLTNTSIRFGLTTEFLLEK